MGPSDRIRRLAGKIEQVARSDFTVIILGETGSGKELVARAVHGSSHRSAGPFVAVDCGAIPETLVESELFGHERGAFTGAVARKPGKFESARNGTLFLDEISNLTLGSQAKLLRALQEKTVWRVGGTEPFDVDVRVLVACNRALDRPSSPRTFRKDLYYRLNEFTIRIPPLRDRREDISYLAERFLRQAATELDKRVRGFSPRALAALNDHDWPGNVRELKTAVRRSVLVANRLVRRRDLDLAGSRRRPVEAVDAGRADLWGGLSLREMVRRKTADLERDVLTRTLRHTGGNKAEAARLLRIDYKTIHTKIKRLGIRPEGD